MLRWLILLASAVSALLCIATVVMWVRSYDQSDEMQWRLASDSPRSAGTLVKFCNASGGMDLEVDQFRTDMPSSQRFDVFEVEGVPAGMVWSHRAPWASRARFFDLFWITNRGMRQDPHLIERKFFVATPHWFFFLTTLVLPTVLVMRRLIRRVAIPAGHCLACGYSLTGNISGVCPECGAAAHPA